MRLYGPSGRVRCCRRWSTVTLAELTLAGDLVRPARLTVPDLLRWPQHRADVSFECATSGIQHHEFAGPRLYDVLADAGPGFDPARRKDLLRFLIAVTGTDGHHALLSWAEIDPDFADAPVLLGVTIDGTPLDAAGPQLVLPQDRCGARHISGITAIRVDGGYRFGTAERRETAGRLRPAPAAPGHPSAATV
ncbi:molybdopterin-dependent oxidoreductase [Streptomyces sp. SP2-10]|uniref:molybdopterin-dependent oxidoreductase n=1 Tax=Streptomyces sp. SP2-10 TaxID=2873385 RepID=UPI001CA655EF|nr:molybdopterin-dependent oxidoreductase [Streptomyces sp. SP2-10]MBY8846846.1 molybdopterin-dependent oxidoreductase [Streptomyces sp. SP2-10]